MSIIYLKIEQAQRLEGRTIEGQGPANNLDGKTQLTGNNQGQAVQNQFAFFQTVRKQWKCRNNECEEKTINCKNGNCDSLENRFKAENYQPELPKLDPIPFPNDFNFAAFFNSNNLPGFDLPAQPQFDNTGEVDLVLNNNNQQYYFTNARYTNSKCINGVCEIITKTCKNGQCSESKATQKL